MLNVILSKHSAKTASQAKFKGFLRETDTKINSSLLAKNAHKFQIIADY
jgi:hypothetical protein